MANYTSISLSEMDECLSSEKGWTREVFEGRGRHEGEQVYSFELKTCPGVTIKVWSSISEGRARRVGADAIRVCATRSYGGAKEYGYIKATRVHRVGGWRENLRGRVHGVIASAKERYQIQEGQRAAQASPARVEVAVESTERQALRAWLAGYQGSFEFLVSLRDQLAQRGNLSERQWESAGACNQRDIDRAARVNRRSQGRSSRGAARVEETPVAAPGRLVIVEPGECPWG